MRTTFLNPKLVACLAVLSSLASAQTAPSKPAEQVFKNITTLKGIPADQLMPTMQFISASLGVECSFCHVQGKMDADDKEEKKTARMMINMMAEINKNHFGGHPELSCYSCHHGSAHPQSVPAVLESDAMEKPHTHDAPAAGAAAPSVDDILNKYVAALGGAEAMRAVKSRAMKGVIVANGSDTPIEVFTKAPNMRITITHAKNGDSLTAFDGKAGWMGGGGRPAREMSAAESAAASLDAEFYFGLRVKEIYPQLRAGRPGMVGEIECDTLMGSAPGMPAVRLYFEKSSGLLLRMVRYAETPLGRMPTQIDYADYHVVNGVKTPYRWTLSRPNGRFTIQISEATANAPIDDSKFAKPAAEGPK